MQDCISEKKTKRAKFNLFREKTFDGLGTYRIDQLRLDYVASVGLSLSGTVSVSEDDMWVIEDSSGSLSFLNTIGQEVATIDLLNIEIHRKWMDRVSNLFLIDLQKEIFDDAQTNPIEFYGE